MASHTKLDLMCRNATFFQKRARGVGPSTSKALQCGVAVGQSQIVQDRRDRQELGVWKQVSPFGNSTPKSHERIAWLKRYGSEELLASSIASCTMRESITLIPAKTISTVLLMLSLWLLLLRSEIQ